MPDTEHMINKHNKWMCCFPRVIHQSIFEHFLKSSPICHAMPTLFINNPGTEGSL